MKKKKTKANPRRQPKAKPKSKKTNHPWYKSPSVAPKVRAGSLERLPFDVITIPADEIELRHKDEAEEIAREIEARESDPDAEPEEESE